MIEKTRMLSYSCMLNWLSMLRKLPYFLDMNWGNSMSFLKYEFLSEKWYNLLLHEFDITYTYIIWMHWVFWYYCPYICLPFPELCIHSNLTHLFSISARFLSMEMPLSLLLIIFLLGMEINHCPRWWLWRDYLFEFAGYPFFKIETILKIHLLTYDLQFVWYISPDPPFFLITRNIFHVEFTSFFLSDDSGHF